MKDKYSALNNYLVEFFNEILRIEENSLSRESDDLSLKEMHVIEAVINTTDNTAGNIAAKLNITTGTLSTAIKILEAKGYIERRKGGGDRRQVLLAATEKGLAENEKHQEFHHKMVTEIIEKLSAKELDIFMKGLDTLNNHFYSLKKL